jgi:hypothetical protein
MAACWPAGLCRHQSIVVFNELLRPHMSEADVLNVMAQSHEFESMMLRWGRGLRWGSDGVMGGGRTRQPRPESGCAACWACWLLRRRAGVGDGQQRWMCCLLGARLLALTRSR